MSYVWALGCILYEMLMMKLPFHKAKHELWGVFSPPDHANDELNHLVKRILVVNSKDRPDVNALLQHERVAALTDALRPAAAEGGADADAEAAQEGAEDKDADDKHAADSASTELAEMAAVQAVTRSTMASTAVHVRL